ncbi:branched-chain amino acid aminotransferase [Stratiformator vulcanicus]|uniref:Branched-chain amino acid aminotransferase n=1 Tax=Stratiformator vulcanicus TaxID=2527980 RepID=A0A517R267_9PLAN|nr:branched-chain amino acid aminotransferase [Stratiformator vulcanicus]QDT37958.1 hypothetical protein Pan189_23420 [Stratiformator vulcanicus]
MKTELNLTNSLLTNLWNDEAGVILSAEIVLVLTIAVLSVVVGLNAVAKAVVFELADVASAIGAVSQSFHVEGFHNEHGNACTDGFGFQDRSDECDCAVIFTNGGGIKVDRVNGPGSGGPEGGRRGK